MCELLLQEAGKREIILREGPHFPIQVLAWSETDEVLFLLERAFRSWCYSRVHKFRRTLPVLVVVIAAAGALAVEADLALGFYFWGQLLAAGGLLGWVWRQAELGRRFAALPVGAWICGAVLAGGVLWGQWIRDSHVTYPFPAWNMYAHPEPRPLLVLEYTFASSDGKVLPLGLYDAVPGPSRGFLNALNSLVGQALSGNDPDMEVLATLNLSLERLALLLEARGRAADIASVQIWLLSWDKDGDSSIHPRERQLIHFHEIPRQ